MKDKDRQTKPFPSEEDTERAWQTFRQKVQGEPVPAVWLQLDAARKNSRHDDVQAAETKHTGQVIIIGTKRMEEKKPIMDTNWTNEQSKPAAKSTARYGKTGWRRWRGAATGAAAIALAIGMLTTSWGDKALAAMLQTFHVQHMQVVGVTDNDWEHIEQELRKGAPEGQTFNLDQFGTIRQEGGGKAQTMSRADAEKAIGFPLYDAADASGKITVSPETDLMFKLNAAEVNRMIEKLGGKSLLPQSADGKEIRFHLPASASLELPLDGGSRTAQLVQAGTPTLELADGINAEAVRQAILDLPVLPAELRSKLAAISDWKNTLPIPNTNGNVRHTELNGREAVVGGDAHGRYLVWIENGRINMLGGSQSDFPGEDDIINAAKELLKQ